MFALFMRARVILCNLWKRYCSVRISPLSSDTTFPVNHKGDKGARLSKACPRLTQEDYWPHPERAEACFIIEPWKRYFLHSWKAVWQYRGNFLVNEQVVLWILAWNRSRRHKTWASPFFCCCCQGKKGHGCLIQQDLCRSLSAFPKWAKQEAAASGVGEYDPSPGLDAVLCQHTLAEQFAMQMNNRAPSTKQLLTA